MDNSKEESEGEVKMNVKEVVTCFPLERCMRIVPQDQNGGAFFVAVFHKSAPLPGKFTDYAV